MNEKDRLRPSDAHEPAAERPSEPLVREEERPPTEGGAKTKRKPSRARLLVWLIELALLLACVEHFVVRPWLARRSPAKPPRKVILPFGDPAPLVWGGASPVAGVAEYSEARLSLLRGLADGSAAARETQVMTSRQHRLPIEIENGIAMRFRLIPAGTFSMGSPETERGRWEGEKQHVASVSRPFYLGTHEVTQAQWMSVMPTNPSRFDGDNRPVEEVDWYDCQRFVIALCEKEGVDVGTYRLPTEIEWEYACRAGTTTAYHFGSQMKGLGAFADYAGNNDRETREVGRRRPNAYGLYDMHGNVWEWCQDLFKAYPGGPALDPSRRDWRMLRGGNWHEPASTCRSANRCRLPPLSKGNVLGFRVLRRIDAAFLEAPGGAVNETPGADSQANAKEVTPTQSIENGAETPKDGEKTHD
ncbi:MAG: formylglycine-generating enzyme family protein [Lentisphaerae bacterium]|jgi:formylglycine-generating enzyme required for sulfatase activity|nr:formylglycine-generating enzyme family protein [Lentisphaerota bacterium]MBT5610811.1 formylglycine-generating enzyme family protein [Lentisphaerota bacterium]MBT7053757.1 formylglycine-generating enzyme family protein [Lentisphaerota bacterium]MBT7841218.1 formylglycine-generating enzyme family protein [Lentisphaerota bacterium]